MQTCDFCQGRKIVQNPVGQIQKCPICEGTGKSDKGGFWFVYGYEFNLPANPNGTVPQQRDVINIVNTDFKLVFIVGVAQNKFLITLGDSTRKLPFSSIPIHSDNIIGTAQNPFPVLVPYTWSKGGVMQVDTSSLDTAATNQLRLAFHGVNIVS